MYCPTPMDIRDTGAKYNNIYKKVPCGHCLVCKSNYRNEWTIRINEEMKIAESAYFVTLTYHPDKIPYKDETPTLLKKDVQDFHKRLRRFQSSHSDQKIRFYSVGEYGTETHRPHYHSIYFNLTENTANAIEEIWQNGQIVIAIANEATIHYVTKYLIDKTNYPEEALRPFTLMSRNPGIGNNYISRTRKYHKATQIPYHTNGDIISNLPRYYKNKIFTEEEKKKQAELAMLRINLKNTEPPTKRQSQEQAKQSFYTIRRNIKKGKL